MYEFDLNQSIFDNTSRSEGRELLCVTREESRDGLQRIYKYYYIDYVIEVVVDGFNQTTEITENAGLNLEYVNDSTVVEPKSYESLFNITEYTVENKIKEILFSVRGEEDTFSEQLIGFNEKYADVLYQVDVSITI